MSKQYETDVESAALYIEKDSKGRAYFSVTFKMKDGKKHYANLFYNKYKADPKHPDYATISEKQQNNQDPNGDIPF